MLQFLKYFFATLLALVFFFFFITIVLIGIGVSASRTKEVVIKENSVLILDLSNVISDTYGSDPFEDINIPGFQTESKISLPLLKKAIKAAAKDDNIKGIFLPVETVAAGPAILLEVRDDLKAFKESGKFIYSYGEVFSEGAYYINSIADSIFMLPTGYLEVNGLFSETVFITGFLEKIGVKPEIFKVGEFKSAVEPLERKSMSEASKLQTTQFIKGIYDIFLNQVSESRKIDKARLELISDSMLVRNAADALELGLVDRLAYYDEVLSSLHSRCGLDSAEDVSMIGLKKYLKTVKDDNVKSKNRIAVLVAEGDIVSESDEDRSVASNTFTEEIRKARKDDKVKAIVLRINSPGGSALASDVIWREVMLTKGVKPIIASMSSVAASGGYYIAMACDTIVAQPNSITGSIGVFGVFFNVQELINDKLGVYSDGVKTGEFSDLGNPGRPFTAFERQLIQNEVEEIYKDFTGKAAQARKQPIDNLLKVASGRVWTGSDAKTHGLVDVLGGLDKAIALASAAAGVENDFQVRYYPQQKNFFEKIFEGMSDEVSNRIVKQELGVLYPMVKQAKQIQNWNGVQARMPIHMEFH